MSSSTPEREQPEDNRVEANAPTQDPMTGDGTSRDARELDLSADGLVEGETVDINETMVNRLSGTTGKSVQSLSVELGIELEPPSRSDSVGRLQHYEIQGLIGHGGMGVVARAVDENLSRQVAIKVMHRSLVSSVRGRQRFLREARSAASINHPNVVTIHAVHELNGVPFLVMECVPGRSLDEIIREKKSLPIKDAVEIGCQIARGLYAAHERNVIHRDVKPGNVLIESGLRRVKLTDFGLARMVVEKSSLTSLGCTVGTPSYMAPEQVDSDEVTARTDLFSLGCVLYAMIDGRSPFRANTPLAAAHKIRTYEPPRLRTKHPHVPLAYDNLVTELLAKMPRRRPASAAVVATRLQNLLNDLQSADSAVGSTPAKDPPGRMLPTLVMMAGAVTLVMAMLATGLWLSLFPAGGNTLEKGLALAKAPEGSGLALDPVIPASRLVNANLTEQIRMAKPGTVITVPAGRHLVSLTLDAENASGLVVRGGPDVTLVAIDQPIIHIVDAPRIILEDLRLETDAVQNAVMIQGECPGLQLRDCHFVHNLDSLGGACLLHLSERVAGQEDAPLQLTRCTFETNRVALVVGSPDNAVASSQWVSISECKFINHGLGRGIGMVIQGMTDHVLVNDCQFEGGNVGVSMQLTENVVAQNIRVEHCLFSKVPTPLHLNRSDPKHDVWIDGCVAVDGWSIRCTGGLPMFRSWFGNLYAIDSRPASNSMRSNIELPVGSPFVAGNLDMLEPTGSEPLLATGIRHDRVTLMQPRSRP